MKKGLFAFVFLFVCNLFTFGVVNLGDFRSQNRSSSDAVRGLMIFFLFAVIVIVLLIVVNVIKRRIGGSSALILTEFTFNENEEEFLKIKGRASGFWNWVLSLFNKVSITSFTCNKRVLKYEVSKIKYNIPLVKIACVSSGMLFKSSIMLLVLGLVFFVLGVIVSVIGRLFPLVLLLILFGIVFFVCFFLIKSKTIHFSIYIGENRPMVTIAMKKGIINSINNEKFEAAANLLNRFVLANAVAK